MLAFTWVAGHYLGMESVGDSAFSIPESDPVRREGLREELQDLEVVLDRKTEYLREITGRRALSEDDMERLTQELDEIEHLVNKIAVIRQQLGLPPDLDSN